MAVGKDSTGGSPHPLNFLKDARLSASAAQLGYQAVTVQR
jgi:hypothetical protein